MSQPASAKCIEVVYEYRRDDKPNDNRWHMVYTILGVISDQADAVPKVDSAAKKSDTIVHVRAIVPCADKVPDIAEDAKDEYEELADAEFKLLLPHAELA